MSATAELNETGQTVALKNKETSLDPYKPLSRTMIAIRNNNQVITENEDTIMSSCYSVEGRSEPYRLN